MKIGGTKVRRIALFSPSFICQLQNIHVILDEFVKLSSAKQIYWQICQPLANFLSFTVYAQSTLHATTYLHYELLNPLVIISSKLIIYLYKAVRISMLVT